MLSLFRVHHTLRHHILRYHILVIPLGEIWVVPPTWIEIITIWVELLLGFRGFSQKLSLLYRHLAKWIFDLAFSALMGSIEKFT